MFSEMMGIIFIAASVGRLMHLVSQGFELRYRPWVKKVIYGFWGAVFAVGMLLLGLY